jgi:hypothetical protein
MRDIVEPSSTKVQGVHRKNFVLSSERDKVIGYSVRKSSARHASSKRLPGGHPRPFEGRRRAETL